MVKPQAAAWPPNRSKRASLSFQQSVKVDALDTSAGAFQTSVPCRRYDNSGSVESFLQFSGNNACDAFMGVLNIYHQKFILPVPLLGNLSAAFKNLILQPLSLLVAGNQGLYPLGNGFFLGRHHQIGSNSCILHPSRPH